MRYGQSDPISCAEISKTPQWGIDMPNNHSETGKSDQETALKTDEAEVENDADNGLTEQVEHTAEESKTDEGFAALLAEYNPEELATRLLAAESQIAEMQDGYVRARAEVENVQRRSQNEIVSARKFAIEGFARELLSVLDSLDQASKVEIEEVGGEAVTKMREGLELTLKQFEQVLEKFGVAVVTAEAGTRFDPECHQAISMVPGSEIEPDHIVSVMQKGYTLKDRLLRPAMVVVAQ